MAGAGLSKRPALLSLPAADQFFMPRSDPKRPRLQTNKFCELLLSFIVNNNLPISLIERDSFRELIFNISPATAICSARTLQRDLVQKFKYHRESLNHELQAHTREGGRVSLTTDSWSARNGTEFAAVTAHWINVTWNQRSVLLDMVHLTETYIGASI